MCVQDALRSVNNSSLVDESETEATIDFINYGAEDAYIALKISIFGSVVGFEFKATPIPLEDVDVLRAQLIDAQEEIITLKGSMETFRKAH